MYTIEMFDGSDWKVASEHTLLIDAQMQLQRFIDNGIDATSLRLVEPKQ